MNATVYILQTVDILMAKQVLPFQILMKKRSYINRYKKSDYDHLKLQLISTGFQQKSLINRQSTKFQINYETQSGVQFSGLCKPKTQKRFIQNNNRRTSNVLYGTTACRGSTSLKLLEISFIKKSQHWTLTMPSSDVIQLSESKMQLDNMYHK